MLALSRLTRAALWSAVPSASLDDVLRAHRWIRVSTAVNIVASPPTSNTCNSRAPQICYEGMLAESIDGTGHKVRPYPILLFLFLSFRFVNTCDTHTSNLSPAYSVPNCAATSVPAYTAAYMWRQLRYARASRRCQAVAAGPMQA
ncbi:hypothetical protein DFH06DRAFT_1177552 [Mycena polygramma]|nr:hypothetical protein DFH06DRAFT_1177552 [Mycena polygramma]